MAVAVKVGSWGVLAGQAQDIARDSQPRRLDSIAIYISEAPRACVCGFSFVYIDQNDEHVAVGPWGMPNDNPQIGPFSMNPGEYVNNMSGTFDDDGVTSLKFTTNQDRDYGPSGSEMGTAFSVPLPPNTTEDEDTADGAVVAFFGRSDNTGLKALGIYVPVMQGSRVKIGPWGGSGEKVDINTPVELKTVSVNSTTHLGGRIYGFSFTYIDRFGNLVDVRPWGNTNMNKPPHTFCLEQGEYVNHITGTVDYKGVTSLTFTTNQNKVHGPYGRRSGTAFSVPRPDYSRDDGLEDDKGGVVGFFGRSGDSLIAIGFYVSVMGNDGPVKLGPWGGFGSAYWNITPYGDPPGISITTHGQRITAIEGTRESDGSTPDTFYLSEDEYVKGFSGSFDDDGVTSLTFTTNRNIVHGPYGRRSGTDFTVPLPDDNGAVVGFVCYEGKAIAAYIGLPPDPSRPARPMVQTRSGSRLGARVPVPMF